MGWNDHIDVTDIEQEILIEWYPDYIGDVYEHPDYDRIYNEASDRYIQRQISAAEGRKEV